MCAPAKSRLITCRFGWSWTFKRSVTLQDVPCKGRLNALARALQFPCKEIGLAGGDVVVVDPVELTQDFLGGNGVSKTQCRMGERLHQRVAEMELPRVAIGSRNDFGCARAADLGIGAKGV
jgi:hypothetical protein